MRIKELVSWLAHWWIWWPRHSVGRGGYGTQLEVGATALCWKWWLRHSVRSGGYGTLLDMVATALLGRYPHPTENHSKLHTHLLLKQVL